MTPDDFAAILAARTPGWLRPFPSPATDRIIWLLAADDRVMGVVPTENPVRTEQDATAIVAAVNLAPLLLDLWSANIVLRRAQRQRTVGEWRDVTAESDAVDAALAALEAADA